MSDGQWWSWALTVVGITGIWLAGSSKRIGWGIGIGAQVLWISYGIVTRQWGFIVSALVYGFVYFRNWIKWTREAREKEEAA